MTPAEIAVQQYRDDPTEENQATAIVACMDDMERLIEGRNPSLEYFLRIVKESDPALILGAYDLEGVAE